VDGWERTVGGEHSDVGRRVCMSPGSTGSRTCSENAPRYDRIRGNVRQIVEKNNPRLRLKFIGNHNWPKATLIF